MNRIRLLPEQVANQIAAGEVIERPASVVKELVENALDAQAGRVSVEIQAGGRSLVRVTDDGVGMSRDDALLCLERHATSKIRRAEDLAAIATLGFRGEALPSIASVSRFTLTTRERDSDSPEGSRIVLSGGKILEVKAAGCAPGTSVEVRQLFFNLPARRKFLRAEQTESAHILHYLSLAALAFPQTALSFQKDGRLVWQLPAVPLAGAGPDIPARLAALRERLRALYGDEQYLLPVDFSATLSSRQLPEEEPESAWATATPSPAQVQPNFRLWGFIGAPGVSRLSREDQHIFVNRRPVENRGLNFALLEGYHTSLMKGRYPVCCLFVEIGPAAVDVNIHPTKREVRFHQEAEVRRLVTQAVRQTLLGFAPGQESKVRSSPIAGPTPPATPSGPQPGAPGATETAESEGAGPEPQRTAEGAVPGQASLPNLPAQLRPPAEPSSSAGPATQPPLRLGFGRQATGAPVVGRDTGVSPAPGGSPAPAQPVHPPAPSVPAEQDHSSLAPPPPPSPPLTPPPPAVPLLEVPLRLLGVVGRLYVVLESDRGLVLLDQHAAHERILFEQMLNRLEQHDEAPSQKLLLPETIELSARDAAFVREQLAVLTRLGVGLHEFGERTFLLDALPPFVKAPDPRRFVRDLLDELKATGQEVNTLRLGELMVAKTVCRHAVKARDPLAGPELEALIEDLRHCAMPYTCPHGRPTIIEISSRELEKKFGRTQ
jgi:DNA mismatch repair protein MutL